MGVNPLRRDPGWSLELFLAACCGGLVLAGLTLGGGEKEEWLIDTARTLGQQRPSDVRRLDGKLGRGAWGVEWFKVPVAVSAAL